MKQRITPEQLQELSQEQRERLREWWQPRMRDGDWFYGTYGGRDEVDKWMISPYCVDSGVYGSGSCPDEDSMPDKDALPLLSIGQCIELLQSKDKNGEYWLIGKIECRPYNGGKPMPGTVSWVIHMIKQGTFEVKVFDQCHSRELIDAFFEAVKVVL